MIMYVGIGMAKLTLSVDADVVVRAKEYAGGRGVSVSSLVEDYLGSLGAPAKGDFDPPPILKHLQNALSGVKIGDQRAEYRAHLQEKYGR